MLGLKLNHVSKRGSWQLSLIINHAAVLQNIPLCPYSYISMVTIDFNTAYIHKWTDVFFAMPQFKQAVCMLNKEWCCLRLNFQAVGYPIATWIVLTSPKLTGYREVAPIMTARWHAISYNFHKSIRISLRQSKICTENNSNRTNMAPTCTRTRMIIHDLNH